MKSILSLIAWIGVFIVVCTGMFFGLRIEQMIQRSIVVYFVLYAGVLLAAVVIGVGFLSKQKANTNAGNTSETTGQ